MSNCVVDRAGRDAAATKSKIKAEALAGEIGAVTWWGYTIYDLIGSGMKNGIVFFFCFFFSRTTCDSG